MSARPKRRGSAKPAPAWVTYLAGEGEVATFSRDPFERRLYAAIESFQRMRLNALLLAELLGAVEGASLLCAVRDFEAAVNGVLERRKAKP